MKFLKSFLIVFLTGFLLGSCGTKGPKPYPEAEWQQYADVSEAGFTVEGIRRAREIYDTLNLSALLVIHDGRVLVSWGDVERRFMCHSVRKSLLSGLYGIYVGRGVIDPDKTLSALKITDKYELTEEEKQATIRDLLKSRSGVYHPAAYETARMKELRPERGSHPHGTYWYYNNWDFNVLRTIFMRETGKDFFTAFRDEIAHKTGMQDFRLIDCYYHLEPEHSIHPAYPFMLSARDMARYGLLYLREGRWKEEQIIPSRWVRESTTPCSRTNRNGGYNEYYSYLWWNSEKFKKLGMYSALGVGSQTISVIPGAEMVIVQRVNTFDNDRETVSMALYEALLNAREGKAGPDAALVPLSNNPSWERPPVEENLPDPEQYTGNYQASGEEYTVAFRGERLLLEFENGMTLPMIPFKENLFVLENAEKIVQLLPEAGENRPQILVFSSIHAFNLYHDLQKGNAATVLSDLSNHTIKASDLYNLIEIYTLYGEVDMASMLREKLGS